MKILLTGAGSPATWGTAYSLKGHELIGVDIRDVTAPLERVYRVSKPSPEFIETLFELCLKEQVNVVIPQVEQELYWLSRERRLFEAAGIRVLVSKPTSLSFVGKYSLLKCFPQYAPGYRYVFNENRGKHDEVMRAIGEIGFPCVVKSLGNSGGNGVRVVKEQLDWSDFEGKPGNAVSFADLIWMLGDKKYNLLVTEYLPGAEYTVDVLMRGGVMIACIPRRRDIIRTGITFEGVTVNHSGIIKACKEITERTGLEYVVGFQFKENSRGEVRVLECNPRVQGTTVHSTLAGANIIQAAVTGQFISQGDIQWGTKITRYWGGLSSLERTPTTQR